MAEATAARKRAAVPDSPASSRVSRSRGPARGPQTRRPKGAVSNLAPIAARQRRSACVSSDSRGFAISTARSDSAASTRARFVALFDGGAATVPLTSFAGGNAR